MNSVKLVQNVCRICLGNKATFNWNDDIFEFSGKSYKYCYYKYTQIKETDADNFPTNLCGRCASEVKMAHTLFEKALESFIILQNTVKAKECEALYTDPADPHTEINELICYSPDQDENMEETENTIIHNSKVSETRKKVKSSATSLELNLQLEIRCPKLFKSTANKSTIKTCKSFHQTPIKKDQRKGRGNTRKLLDNTTPQRKEFSDQCSFSQTPSGNTENQQLSSTKTFDGDKLITFTPLNYPLSNLNLDQSEINSSDHFSSQPLKERQKSALENEKIENKPSDYSTLEQDIEDEDDTNSAAFLNTNSSLSKESQMSSLSDGSAEKKNDTFKPSEVSLLEKIYGKHFDIKSLKSKSKRRIKEKICQYCSLTILGTKRLIMHEATHLEQRERNIVCQKCGIKLYTKEALSEHIKIHIENRQKQHKCEFCEKAFFHKGALNVHRRIHLGLMIKCQLCSKEYCRQIDLDKHLASHSVAPLKNEGIKKVKYTVQCQYCNKCISTGSWKAHKAAHLKQPQVKCKICNKEFYARNKCAEHLRKKHRKTADEYEANIHYYVERLPRMTHLIIKQQETIVPVLK